MFAIVTNSGTHPPDYYASLAVHDLVPLPPNSAAEVQIKVNFARSKLFVPVLAAMTAIRDYERKSLESLNGDECELLQHIEHSRHFGNAYHDGVNINTFDSRTNGKLRNADDWLTDHVKNIIAVARDCGGDTPDTNQMINSIYSVLLHHVKGLQLVERSHFVTSTLNNQKN